MSLRDLLTILLVVILAVISLVGLRLTRRKQKALFNAARLPEVQRELKAGEVPRIQGADYSRDFVDLTFGIGATHSLPDGTILIPLKAIFDDEEIGFSVRVPVVVPAGLLGHGSDLKVSIVPQGVEFLRDGKSSDKFVTALERLYHLGDRSLSMAERIRTTAVNLSSIDQKLDHDEVKLKLFFNNEPQKKMTTPSATSILTFHVITSS